MAISFKRNDDLEKMMENFAILPDLDKADDEKNQQEEKKADK